MMKKILVALAMFPMVASAEGLAAGTFELTGGSNLGFNSDSVEVKDGTTTDTTQYGLSTTGLYYVIPNLGVGLDLTYDSSTDKANGIKDGLSALLVGPAISYEMPIAPQFAVFGRGNVGYVSATQTHTGRSDITASGYGFGLELGAKYFLVKNFSFDAGLGYDYKNVKDDTAAKNEITTSGFGAEPRPLRLLRRRQVARP